MSDNQKATPSNTLEALNASKDAIVVDATQAAGHLAGQARDRIEGTLSQKKSAAAESIGSIASALRESKKGLEGVGPLPDLAENIEKVADYFETRSVSGVVRDVETFARREPALYLGFAFALGLVGGRFLKSSARPPNEGEGGLDAAKRQDRVGMGPGPVRPAFVSGVAGTTKPMVGSPGSSLSSSRDGARPMAPGRM